MVIFDQIAPLIGIFLQIFKDIAGFILILGIFIFTFSFAFYLLAKNQLDFDGLSEDEADGIPYGTFDHSIKYIGDMLLGETDQDSFSLGEGK